MGYLMSARLNRNGRLVNLGAYDDLDTAIRLAEQHYHLHRMSYDSVSVLRTSDWKTVWVDGNLSSKSGGSK